MKKKKIIKWTLLLIWMLVIFLLSNQPNSGATTYGIIEKILPNVQTNTLISTLNYIIRKLAHITEYFVLAFLTVSLLKEYTKNERLIIFTSIIFCISYAITDEFHQLYVIGRTGAIKDVGIDTIGSIIYLIIYFIYTKIITRNFKTIQSN